MSKYFKSKTGACNIVCAILTLCLLILQFAPFWNYGSGSLSINGYVWLDSDNTKIASWFNSQLGYEPGINAIVVITILVLVLGAASIIACIMKADNRLASFLSAATSISALYAFVFEPVFRLGSTWVIQLILSILTLIFAVMAIVCGSKRNRRVESVKTVLSQSDIQARVDEIKALGNADGSKNEKSKIADTNENFNKLLDCLTDDAPECRAAAAEMIGQTSRDAAFTNIVHLLDSEKDERVIKAMKEALKSIRENEKLEHSEHN